MSTHVWMPRLILTVYAICSAVYRATPLYDFICYNLQGSLPLPVFQMKILRVREVN